MREIKVRIRPLLKKLGLKHVEGSMYETLNSHGQRLYDARVYKMGGSVRYIEIHKTVYDEFGEKHHVESVAKNLPMDVEYNERTHQFYEDVLRDLATKMIGSNRTYIERNIDYLLGLTEERVEV